MKALPWIVAGVGVSSMLAYMIWNNPAPQTDTGWDTLEGSAQRVGRWGSRARLSAVGNTVTGKAKQGLGRVVGNDNLAAEGALGQAVGAMQNGAGELAQAAGQTIHDLNH
jgi:uncharacterized protein YjbJ (UPF0337 family)